MKFAFISRHVPNQTQIDLAAQKGIELVHVGDRDAFSVSHDEFRSFDGVVVVHPAMALRLLTTMNMIGVFNNVNRAPVGEKPQFEATQFHIFEPNPMVLRVDMDSNDPICCQS